MEARCTHIDVYGRTCGKPKGSHEIMEAIMKKAHDMVDGKAAYLHTEMAKYCWNHHMQKRTPSDSGGR